MKPLHLIGKMTPEEKALELIKGFSQYSAVRILDLNEYDIQRKANVTQCAILCVEEILSMRDLSLLLSPYNADSYRTYYTKVKDELLKKTI
jgi:hypothetical protein